MLSALEIFVNTGVHRIPVVTKDNHVCGMLSIHQAMALINKSLSQVPDFQALKLSDMYPYLRKEICVVSEFENTITALTQLCPPTVNFLGLVDSEGSMSDQLSIRDLRNFGMNPSWWKRMHLTTAQFKAWARNEVKKESLERVVFVSGDDSMKRLLHLFQDGNIHRVFEHQNPASRKPTHSITQGDFLRYLLVKLGVARSGGTPYTVAVSNEHKQKVPEPHVDSKEHVGDTSSLFTTTTTTTSYTSTTTLPQQQQQHQLQQQKRGVKPLPTQETAGQKPLLPTINELPEQGSQYQPISKSAQAQSAQQEDIPSSIFEDFI
jgi:hypothetical protein